MSVWGLGPMENDGAVDFRDQIVDQLRDKIRRSLLSDSAAPDDIYWIHGAIDVLLGVCSHCNVIEDDDILEDIDEWRSRLEELLRPNEDGEMAASRKDELKLASFATLAALERVVSDTQANQ